MSAADSLNSAAPLNSSALAALDSGVSVPKYDPRAIKAGIVHFGVGGFHRSHQAMYLERLLNRGEEQEWGICGVGVLPGDLRMRDVLAQQNHLYTLVTRAHDGTAQAQVIGSITEFLFAPQDPEAVIEKLAHPGTRIVSLTVTEGGYSLNNATGEFDPSGADIQHDLQPGAVPKTTFGLLTEGLRRRCERGIAPFTIMSCDNIQGNGYVTQRVLGAFARLKDPALGEWIAAKVAFPNSMVDRITPVTTPQMKEDLAREFGIADEWPVVAEDFEQWVLEDHFPLGRPALEKVGVQLVTDVEPYELMKLRLLNASHQALAYLGLLAGYTQVHEVCRDADFQHFLLGYMRREALPTLRPVPGIELDTYCQQLIARFSNEAVRDTLARLVVDASERIPKFLLPVARERLEQGANVPHIALVIAAWAEYICGVPQAELLDPRAPELRRAALADQQAPGTFLKQPDIFGDLAAQPDFREAYLAAAESLKARGARGAMQALISS